MDINNKNKNYKIFRAFTDAFLSASLVCVNLAKNDIRSATMLKEKLGELLETLCKVISAKDNVAQYVDRLLFQTKNLINIFAIIENRTRDLMPVLIARRDLLLFETVIIETKKSLNKKVEAGPDKDSKPVINNGRTKKIVIGKTKKRIIDILQEKAAPVINLEIFQMLDVSRRNLKRNLRELIEAGLIKRENQGKKVYYAIK
ncbi:MAG: hypothetical protein Q8Q06_02680 [bacterium]|nr:hypothetical protein [bacterium]